MHAHHDTDVIPRAALASPGDADDANEDFEQVVRDVWRALAHSVARNHAAFAAIGAAVRDPGGADGARLSRALEKYLWEERKDQEQAVAVLEKLANRVGGTTLAAETAAAWRCANGLERLSECGRKGWALAIQQLEGRFALDEDARAETGHMLQRLEELVYWTLEAMRTHYAGSGREVLDIARKESGVALRLFEASVREGERTHRDRCAAGVVGIPAEVAFFDFVAMTSHAGRHLAGLLELALGETASMPGPVKDNRGNEGRA